MSIKWAPKDPDDIADYLFDWGSSNIVPVQQFLPAAETITTFTITIDPGLTLVSSALTYAAKAVTFRVSGGTAGTGYAVECVINTSAGQRFEVTKTLQVAERIST